VQRRNLYGEKPKIVQRLKVLLERYKVDGRSTPGPRQSNTPLSGTRPGGSIPDENPPQS
jgi:hypothetical protein